MPMTRSLLARSCALALIATALPPIGAADVAPSPGASASDARPRGVVRVEQGLLVDAGGPFWAIGVTYMAAPWFYKFDRARLERDLAFLADHGVDYVRVLGEVGGGFWRGREIDPRWPDYESVVGGLTDLAFDRFGLRVQWTVFGGVEASPTPADRQAVVDRVVDAIAARPNKVMLLEIANEGWKNGFEGAGGREELKALVRRAAARLGARRAGLPVAPTAPPSAGCDDVTAFYAGLDAQVATLHFSRDVSGPEREWAPIVEPIRYRPCPGTPAVVANNEPIGPRSSVESDDDPTRLVSAALVTLLSGVPLHVLHSRAGVRGDIDFASLPGVAATLSELQRVRPLVPRAIARATPVAADTPDALLELRSPVVPDIGAGPGVVAFQVVRLGEETLAVAVGVRGPLSLRARRVLSLEAHDLRTGSVVERVRVSAGEVVDLGGSDAWFVRARPDS